MVTRFGIVVAALTVAWIPSAVRSDEDAKKKAELKWTRGSPTTS
jgi:hypothetical protein